MFVALTKHKIGLTKDIAKLTRYHARRIRRANVMSLLDALTHYSRMLKSTLWGAPDTVVETWG